MLTAVLLLILDLGSAAPPARESYRMPQSALQALSDRGTVVLEAALASALSALERVASERRAAETTCRGCVPCLFQDCGQRSGPCDMPSVEPTCEVINKVQKLPNEQERNWAMSQACGFYRRRCPAAELDSGSCIRIMGESCSMRAMQCSLLSTMRILDTPQANTQALCGHRPPLVHNATQPRSKIVGGSLASPGSWPWLVNLRLDGGLMCGGVLVDSSWVVTAAHCFSGSRSENQWTAVVGEFDITKSDPDEQIIKVNRIVTHPKFNPKTFNNDIGLVELMAPAMLSDRVRPVCLPSGPDPSTGTPCLVAGWGSLYEDGPSAEQVMEAKVPLLPQSTCRNALGKELVTNTMFCAGFLSGGVDSCQGDSGGPLIYQDKLSGRFHLYGITSWGDGCGEQGKPGVYTRVTAFADWIQAEMQKSAENREPTCPELLKTSELSEEQQRSEFGTLCRFYSQSCPQGQGAACSRLAEDKCRTRFKKCQMRSFLQTLLDLLQRAEDYIRDKVDLTFFTQTLPQLVEHIYSTAFSTRERRAALAGRSHRVARSRGSSPNVPFREGGAPTSRLDGLSEGHC
ncbi:serine protease 56 [Scleropages formosus]|uniref:serine protease 56 n=1 Tax=Scleropages formosus TaxID=113540 RepID=UPI0010FAACBF|nr:serine protease 56 [Scleropages formosus]